MADIGIKIKADHEEAQRKLQKFQEVVAAGFGPMLGETQKMKDEMKRLRDDFSRPAPPTFTESLTKGHEEAKRRLEEYQKALANGFGPAIAETKRLEQELAKLKSKTEEQAPSGSWFDKLKGSAGGMVGVATLATGAAAALKFLYDQYAEGAKAAREQELAEVKLGSALMHRGDATGAVLGRLREVNEELSRKRGLDETELANVQRSLSLHGLQNNQLAAATRVTIGLAKVTGQDLNSAGVDAAKIFEGNIGFLKRLGIEAKDSADAIEKLTAISNESTGVEKTYAGQVNLLSHEWSELRKEFAGTPKEGGIAVTAIGGVRAVVAALRDDLRIAHQDGWFEAFAESARKLAAARRGQTEGQRTGTSGMGDAQAAERKLAQQELEKALAKNIATRDEWQKTGDKGEEEADKRREDRNKRLAHEALELAAKQFNAETERQHTAEEQRKADVDIATKFAESAARQRKKEADDIRRANTEKLKFEEDYSKKLAAFLKDRADAKKQLIASNNADDTRAAEAQKDMQAQLASIMASGISDGISRMVTAMVQGKENLGDLAAQLVGTVIIQMGNLMIAMGTAGVLAGTLGTVIPAFAALTGGPLGLAGGLATIAGGVVLVGVGSALGGSGTRVSSGAGAGSGGTVASVAGGFGSGASRSSGFSGASSGGFAPSGGSGSIVNNYTFKFPSGFVVGSERTLARRFEDLLRKGATLRHAGAT